MTVFPAASVSVTAVDIKEVSQVIHIEGLSALQVAHLLSHGAHTLTVVPSTEVILFSLLSYLASLAKVVKTVFAGHPVATAMHVFVLKS